MVEPWTLDLDLDLDLGLDLGLRLEFGCDLFAKPRPFCYVVTPVFFIVFVRWTWAIPIPAFGFRSGLWNDLNLELNSELVQD